MSIFVIYNGVSSRHFFDYFRWVWGVVEIAGVNFIVFILLKMNISRLMRRAKGKRQYMLWSPPKFLISLLMITYSIQKDYTVIHTTDNAISYIDLQFRR